MPIDFTLTRDQRTLQLEAREFARSELSGVREATRGLATAEERFAATRPMYEKLIAAGFLRRIIPAPFGGEGTGMLDMAVLAEEFYAVDVNVSLTAFANVLGLFPIFLGGTDEQKKHFVTPFLQTHGAPLAALGNSEPGGSANFGAPRPAAGTRTTATLSGGYWTISGSKQWVSSASGWDGKGADVLCVVCRTDATAPPERALSVIAVSNPVDGLVVERQSDSVGHRAHLTPRIRLENVRVSQDRTIGPVGGGKALVEGAFTGTAALVGIMSVALMRTAFDFALRFCKREYRGGAVPIVDHQAVGYALADAKATIEASRALSWRACHALDTLSPGAFELSLQAKIFASESAVRVIGDLMRVVGIDSYDHELPLGGLLQDALVLPLFDGGNIGVRRRQLHELMRDPAYDSFAASGATEAAAPERVPEAVLAS
jgi:alkylation response protein AidB-like acyl-CoA dehydrogenase